jgi:hypothetical protein
MKKVLLLLIALVAFAAIPSVAIAGDNQNTENEVEGDQETESEAGGGSAGDGGQAGGGQSATQQCQVAGGDCEQSIDQSQTFNQFGQGGNGDNGEGNGHFDNGDNGDNGVGGGVTTGHVGGVGGGGVGGVTLARTGFDAWVLALLGGLSLAGGLGLLAAQRRGRLNA